MVGIGGGGYIGKIAEVLTRNGPDDSGSRQVCLVGGGVLELFMDY